MFDRIRHHFTQSLPVLLVGGVVSGIWRVVTTLHDVAGDATLPAFNTLIGEGVDEFSTRLGSTGAAISSLIADSNTWVGLTALLATGITVLNSLQHLSDVVDGPGDVAALGRHSLVRLAAVLGMRQPPIRWGIVYDTETGRPLPYARIDAFGLHGRRTARAIADAEGVYGFHLAAEVVHHHGGIGTLTATKDGYQRSVRLGSSVSDVHSLNTDFAMTRATTATSLVRNHKSPAAAQFGFGLAFWAGVVTVPLTLLHMPTVATVGLAGLFSAAAIIRAIRKNKNI